MQKWEYRFVSFGLVGKETRVNDSGWSNGDGRIPSKGVVPPQVYAQYFNKLGEDGWEVVAAASSRDYTLKHPKP